MADVVIDGMSLEELDKTADEFSSLVDAGIEQVIAKTIERINAKRPITAAGEDVDPEEVPGEDDPEVAPSDADSVIPLWAAYVAGTLLPFLAASMRGASNEQAEALAAGLGFALPGIDEPVSTERYLQQASNRLAGIGDIVWFNVRTAIIEGLNAGEGFPVIADRIRDVAPVSVPRANTIARTESNMSRNSVAMQTVRRVNTAFGVTGAIQKEWQATMDSRTRDTHVRADGQRVALNEPFRVGRASLDHPSDPSGPPEEVINCRCVSLTIIDTDMLDMSGSNDVVMLNASTFQEGNQGMPWSIERDNPECNSGQWAVVKDADGTVEGCHDTEEQAQAQLAALNIVESENANSEDTGSFQVDVETPWGDLTVDITLVNTTKRYGFDESSVEITGANEDAEFELTHGEAVGGGFIFEWRNEDNSLVHMELNLDMGTVSQVVTTESGDETAESGTVAVVENEDVESVAASARHVFEPFSGPITSEGVPTGDGRQFENGALTWPDLNKVTVPIGWLYERAHGGMQTDKVVNIGRIDTLERRGNEIWATGVIDVANEYGQRAVQQMGTRENPGYLSGVSVDVDNPDDPSGRTVEYVFPEECKLSDPEDMADEDMAACMVPERMIYKSGRIRAVTLVDIPAFIEGRVHLDKEPGEYVDPDVEVEESEDVMTASARPGFTITLPDIPPADWFNEPTGDPDIGAITVTDDGRMFGYLAPKGVAHRGYRDKRVEVPMKNVDYSGWMNRATIVEDKGTFRKIASGPITMDCGHASPNPKLVGKARQDHYDNSCSIVATARIGENAHGVWIAGALIPDVSADQIRRMMACQLSGDWGPHREKPGKRELVGALVVPVPGFTRRTAYTLELDGANIKHVGVPIRFATVKTEPEAFGLKPAADKIAALIGRDPKSKFAEFRKNLEV